MDLHSILNRSRTRGVADLDKVPNKVILDLEAELKQFYIDSNNMTEFEYDVGQTIGEVLLYTAEINSAPVGLAALGEDIRMAHARENGIVDGDILAKATMKFGEAVFNKFKQIGLYTKEGLLPFEFEGMLNDYSPVLVKSSDHLY